MTEQEYQTKVQELEGKIAKYLILAEQDDWYAELDLRKSMRELSNLRRSYYESFFK